MPCPTSATPTPMMDVVQEFLTGAHRCRTSTGAWPRRRSLKSSARPRPPACRSPALRHLLDEHRARIRRLLARFRGVEADTAGTASTVSSHGPARALAARVRDPGTRGARLASRPGWGGNNTGKVEAPVYCSYRPGRSMSARASLPRRGQRGARDAGTAQTRALVSGTGSANRGPGTTSRGFLTREAVFRRGAFVIVREEGRRQGDDADLRVRATRSRPAGRGSTWTKYSWLSSSPSRKLWNRALLQRALALEAVDRADLRLDAPVATSSQACCDASPGISGAPRIPGWL